MVVWCRWQRRWGLAHRCSQLQSLSRLAQQNPEALINLQGKAGGSCLRTEHIHVLREDDAPFLLLTRTPTHKTVHVRRRGADDVFSRRVVGDRPDPGERVDVKTKVKSFSPYLMRRCVRK